MLYKNDDGMVVRTKSTTYVQNIAFSLILSHRILFAVFSFDMSPKNSNKVVKYVKFLQFLTEIYDFLQKVGVAYFSNVKILFPKMATLMGIATFDNRLD